MRALTPSALAAAALVALAGGCYPVPPPLMAAAAPLEPHRMSYGGALSGSVATNPGYQALADPALELWLRLPLGEGTDAGLRLTPAGSAMADVRHQFLAGDRLTLTAGLDLGVVAVPGAGTDTSPNLVGPPIAGIAEVPVILGWRLGGTTLILGARPGLRVIGWATELALQAPGGAISREAVRGVEPLLGGVLGLEIPVAGNPRVHLVADAMRSFVNPSTIFTVSVGLSKH